MTSTQIQYWNKEETVRHDMATELQAQNELNETITHNRNSESISQIQANAARSQAKTAEKARKTDKWKKHQDVDIDWYNAKSNRRNAKTNRINAGINAQNAETNARNAETNARNAETNARNADTNAFNAKTQRKQMVAYVKKLNLESEKLQEEIDNYDRDVVMRGTGKTTTGQAIGVIEYLKGLIKGNSTSKAFKNAGKAILKQLNKEIPEGKGSDKKVSWWAKYMNNTFGSNKDFYWKNVGGTLVRVPRKKNNVPRGAQS